MNTHTIGLIGYGFIGRTAHKILLSEHQNIEVAWVMDRNADANSDIGPDRQRTTLGDDDFAAVDLVVEMANSEVVAQYGTQILAHTNFLPISLTAFADDTLYDACTKQAEASNTTLFLPHGGALGIDTLLDMRDELESVTITTRKNPGNLAHGGDSAYEVLYEGPARGACEAFPRNVNTHATVALAGIGFDRTQSKVISDPECDGTEFSIEATAGNSTLTLSRTAQMQGVSSATMAHAVVNSITRALQGMDVVFV